MVKLYRGKSYKGKILVIYEYILVIIPKIKDAPDFRSVFYNA